MSIRSVITKRATHQQESDCGHDHQKKDRQAFDQESRRQEDAQAFDQEAHRRLEDEALGSLSGAGAKRGCHEAGWAATAAASAMLELHTGRPDVAATFGRPVARADLRAGRPAQLFVRPVEAPRLNGLKAD